MDVRGAGMSRPLEIKKALGKVQGFCASNLGLAASRNVSRLPTCSLPLGRSARPSSVGTARHSDGGTGQATRRIATHGASVRRLSIRRDVDGCSKCLGAQQRRRVVSHISSGNLLRTLVDAVFNPGLVCRQLAHRTCHLRPRHVILILRNRNRSQDTDDRDHDHQFDQREALLYPLDSHPCFFHGIDPCNLLEQHCAVGAYRAIGVPAYGTGKKQRNVRFLVTCN